MSTGSKYSENIWCSFKNTITACEQQVKLQHLQLLQLQSQLKMLKEFGTIHVQKDAQAERVQQEIALNAVVH